MDNYEPRYREWSPGRFEQWLPESRDDFDQTNRLRRAEHLRDHILAGADRSLCRQFIYTEEEWRSGVRMAGREPGDGWLMRPGDTPKRIFKPETQREETEGPQSFGDIYDQLPF